MRPAPIVLSSKQPCNSVVLEANFHVRCQTQTARSILWSSCFACDDTLCRVVWLQNPSGNPLQYCEHFFGTFAAGAEGLRSESNQCSDCRKWNHSYDGNNRTCEAVGVGPSQSSKGFEVKLNTGDFSETGAGAGAGAGVGAGADRHHRRLKSDDHACSAVTVRALALLLLPGTVALPALQPSWHWSWEKIPSWASGQGATDFPPNVTHYCESIQSTLPRHHVMALSAIDH